MAQKSFGNRNSSKTASEYLTIPSGTSTSDHIDVAGRSPIGFIIPSAMTGTSIKVQASVNGSNFYDLYYNGVAVTFPATVSTWQALPPAALAGVGFIQLVSNGTEAAAREIRVIGYEIG